MQKSASTYNAVTPFLGLAVAAGCVDAISFVGFRGVFTANMTGNTVLLGIGIGSRAGYLPTSLGIAPPLIAIAAFVIGAFLTVPVMGTEFSGRRAAGVVAAEAVLIAISGVAFAFSDRDFIIPLCIGLVSCAMGAQSVAATKARLAGVSTTYVTGTLITAVMKSFSSKVEDRQDALRGVWVWITYLAGALGGALLLVFLHRAALFPAALIFLGLAGWLAYENKSE
jgi:uncharacterized membrane protein YoaK (UPF0700 family)